MNPLTAWKLYRKVDHISDLLKEAQMGKVPWKSRTLWFNLLTTAASALGYIPLDPHTTIIVSGVINGALRLITGKPIALSETP